MKAVFRRELGALMRSMIGWMIFAAVPLVFTVLTAMHLLSGSAADYIRVIADSTVAYGIIALLYAGQGFAKDRRKGADKLLHSLPVSAPQMILGRYFAQCVPFALGVAVSSLYPVGIAFLADLALWQIIFGMLVYLLGGMYVIALSLYVSRIAKNAYLNALIAIVLLCICYYMPNIASLLVSVGMGYWGALAVLAALGVWFGWKASHSAVPALVCGLSVEAVSLLCLDGGNASVRFWNTFAGIVNIQSHFTALYIGVLSIGDIAFFILSIAFLLSLSMFGWHMERMGKRRAVK